MVDSGHLLFAGRGVRFSQSPSIQLHSSDSPASPHFSGWNWVACQRAVSTAARNGRRCSPRSAALPGNPPSRSPRRSARSRTACVGSSPSKNAPPGAASSTFQPMCGRTGASSRPTTPGHSRSPFGRHAALDAPRETGSACRRRCRARTPGGEPVVDDSCRPVPRSPVHQASKAPTPGTTQPVGAFGASRRRSTRPVGARRSRRVGRTGGFPSRSPERRRTSLSQGAFGRRDAGDSWIELDRLPERPREGLVLGLGGMWCGSRPASVRTCRARRALKAIDSKTCRMMTVKYVPADQAIVVCNRCSGSPVCTRYGRPSTSTTACVSVSSIGTRASPKRGIPVLSPSASRGVWPSTAAVSSTCGVRRSRRHPWRSRSGRSCVASERGQQVVVERHAGRDVGGLRSRRGRSRRRCRFVGLWVTRARRFGGRRTLGSGEGRMAFEVTAR